MASTEASSPAPGNVDAVARQQRKQKQWHALNILLLIICLGVFVLSFNRVLDYEDDIARSTFMIRGAIPVPVLEMQPRHGATRLSAIVAHGFSGSKELMTGFGVELARAGITAYLFDFPGHGESPVGLSGGDATVRSGQENLTALGEVVNYVRDHNGDPKTSPIILLGDSMGAAAVGEYAMAHAFEPDMVSTILVSPVGQEQPTETAPRNLLILVGRDDIGAALDESRSLFHGACGIASKDRQPNECGNPANGTGRRMVILPSLNHITILNGSSTFQEMLNWIHRAYPKEVALDQMQSNTRLLWLLAGALSILGAVFPLSALLVEIFNVRPEARAFRGKAVLLFNLCLLIGIAGAIAIQYAWRPFSFLGLALADYVTGYFFFTALIAGACFFLLQRVLPIPPLRQITLQVLIGVVLAAFLYFTLGQLATFAWERLDFTVPRLWRFAVIFVLILPLFLLDEGINRGYQEHSPLRAVLSSLLSKVLLLAGLFVALLLIPGLDFLNIVLPILALLFLGLITFSFQLYRSGRATLAAAILGALLVAWCMATAFPMI